MLSIPIPIHKSLEVDGRRRRRTLTLALFASLAAHLLLLYGIGLPEFERSEHFAGPPLEAHIAPLFAPLPPAEVHKPKTSEPHAKRKPGPSAEPRQALPSPLPAVGVARPADVLADGGAGTDQSPPQAVAAAESPQPASVPQTAEQIPFPDRIYLEFDLAKNADQAPLGRVHHRFEREGARYLIRSVTEATGIAAFFATGRYVQESRGTLSPEGLRPDVFTVRRGRAERTESAAFDWANAHATTSSGGASRDWALRGGAQDQLSFLHQLSFLIGALPSSVMVTNGRRFYSANVEIIGRDVIATGIGPISAVRVRGQLEGEMRMDVWIAPDRGNLPVKVRFRDHRGEEFEQVLAAVKGLE